MTTAREKGRAATGGGRRAERASESGSMEFLIVEDNGGKYHWKLVDRQGNRLARSPRLVSYEQAENAARIVLAGAGSARLDPRAATR